MLKLSQSIKALRAGKRAPSMLLRRCPLKTLEKKLLSVDIPVCSFYVLCCTFCIAIIFLEIGGRSLRFWITTRLSTSSFAACSSEKEEVVDSIFLVSFIAELAAARKPAFSILTASSFTIDLLDYGSVNFLSVPSSLMSLILFYVMNK